MDHTTHIPFENRTPIKNTTELYILCNVKGKLVLYSADNKFYRSFTCEKNTVIRSRESLAEFNYRNLKLPEQVTVLILANDNMEDLVFDRILDIDHFIRYLRFADRECCDLSILENDVALDGIFVNIERRNVKLWKNNKILLTNINLRSFQTMHFPVDPAAPLVAGNYPNFDVLTHPKYKKYVKSVRFEPIETSVCNSLCTQETFNWMIEYLLKLQLHRITKRIMRTILLSFEYCHLAMRCPYLKDVVAINTELSFCIIYAMRILYLEEKSRFGNFTRAPTTSYDDRFIFKLGDVEGLPYYPKYTPDNPYFVEPGMGAYYKQQLSIPSFISGQRGIYDREKALERLDEFTGGVLKNIQWKYKGVRTALCGSTIPAVFIKNVLESYIDHKHYFQEYYPAFNTNIVREPEETLEMKVEIVQHYVVESSEEPSVESESSITDLSEEPEPEIDLSLNELQVAHDHLLQVREKHGPVSQRRPRRLMRKGSSEIAESQYLSAKSNYEAEQRLNAEEIELADVELADVPIDNKLTEDEKIWDKFTDIDLMVETDDYELFDEIANLHFEAVLASASNSRYTPYLKLLYTENKYKYKIYGLPRSIEIFMVNSIPGVISKFHMAPVRAWWDGDDLHMLPTFITAAMTSVCFDLRWISCSKDVRDIVLKYFQRGFSQILNKEECLNLASYINTNPRWPTWTMPAAWVGWRSSRWFKKPIYHENSQIFNPSNSKCGIHYKLKDSGRHGIQPFEYTITISEYKGPNIPKCLTRSLFRKKILSPDKMPKIHYK